MSKKKGNKITAISLFCGCGGADLGLVGDFTYLGKEYPKTGIDIIHASDIDPKAIATYNHNFRHKALCIDINKLNSTNLKADIVMGGFPCQSFSTVNPTKKPHLKKKQLFWQMAEVISNANPKVFIAENVKGFYTLSGGKYYKLAKNEFEKLGYKVFHKIINASDYGVPQKRERLLMIGVRNNINRTYHFPEETHSDNIPSKKIKTKLSAVIDELAIKDNKYYFSEKAVLGAKRAKNNMKRALAQDLNGQCLTITSHLAKVSINSRDPVLLVDPKTDKYRRFTTREAARIQSFPDCFTFVGSDGDAYRQIGNAVPPVVMWNIASSILKQKLLKY